VPNTEAASFSAVRSRPSVANRGAPDTPAEWGHHAPPDDVAATVVIVGGGVIGIAVTIVAVIVVVIAVRGVKSEADAGGKSPKRNPRPWRNP
jgi:hypothetical protein